MLSFFKKIFHRNIDKFLTVLGVILLCVVSIVLFATNYAPGTYLIGWDNTVPELNLSLNFSRFLFPVWQAYRGLGTLDGMAHGANLIHAFIVSLLSFILPNNLIRYVIQLGLHFLGGLGVFILIKEEISQFFFKKKSITKLQRLSIFFASFVSALFYMLNFMTIQMFYVPLELFSYHFAAIPWGIFSFLSYIKSGSRKALVFFLCVNVLIIPQAHVPSIFIVYGIIMASFMLSSLLPALVKKDQRLVKRIVVVTFALVLINSYWGFPYLYTASHKSAEIAQSQINLFSTDEIFARNQSWGDLHSVLTFGGFNIDYLDWNTTGSDVGLMMKDWISFVQSNPFQLASILISILAWIGGGIATVLSLKKKNFSIIPFIILEVFAISMLGILIPGIQSVSEFLRHTIPFFYQIFRFTFTKFSLLYVFSLSISFSFLVLFFIQFKKNRFWQILNILTLSTFLFVIFYLATPAFRGNFFYPNLKQTVPTEYFELQAFFKDISKQERIAIFPLYGFWGWSNNSWGYRGSGFLWQMLPQPTLDRAFDAWSASNETAYQQLYFAIKQNDTQTISDILSKYNIDWIVFDSSLFQPGEYQQSLRAEEIHSIFSDDLNFSLEKKLGSIEVWHVQSINQNQETISVARDYDTKYTDSDTAISKNNYIQNDVQSDISFPFSFLQSTRNIDLNQEKRFSFTLTKDQQLRIPQFSKFEHGVLTKIYSQTSSEKISLTLVPQFPTIDTTEVKRLEPFQFHIDFPIADTTSSSYYLGINKQLFTVQKDAHELFVGDVLIQFGDDIQINMYSDTPSETLNPTKQYATQKVSDCWHYEGKDWSVKKDNNSLRFFSKNASACNSLLLPLNNLDSTRLFRVKANFTSDQVDNGRVCVRKADTFDCLNEQEVNNVDSIGNNNQYEITTFASLGKDNYSVDIINEANKPDEEYAIEYNNISFSQFPLIGSQSISTNEISQIHDNYIGAINQSTLKSDQTVTVHVPVSTNTIQLEQLNQNAQNCDFTKRGEVNKILTNSTLILSSVNKGTICSSVTLPALSSGYQYLFSIKGKVITGTGIKGYLRNLSTKMKDLEFSSGSSANFQQQLVLNPSQNKNEQSSLQYSLNLSAQSFGEKNEVEIDEITLIPFPVNWLKNISYQDENVIGITSENLDRNYVLYPFFLQKTVSPSTSLLTLSQSYDNGWIAFQTPCFELSVQCLRSFFKKSEGVSNWQFWKRFEHVKYNGWANGWIIQSSDVSSQSSENATIPDENKQTLSTYHSQLVTIIYWPQLLEFLGLGLLSVTFFIICIKILK